MKDRRFIVDRIENKSVVLEDDKQDIILIDIILSRDEEQYNRSYKIS
mgnify:CR=1 FL=1